MKEQKRKRGVKASRERLEKAMLAKGIESQIQLARQISVDEGLERPPKELISKVFREQSVSHTNLARVAKALGVESHTLYMNSHSTPIDLHSEPNNIHAASLDALVEQKRRSRPMLALLMVSVLIILIYLFFQNTPEGPSQSISKYELYGYDPKLLNIGFYMPDDFIPLNSVAEGISTTLAASNLLNFSQVKSFVGGAKSIKEYFAHTQSSLLFRIELMKRERYSIILLYAETEQANYPVAYRLVRNSLLPNKQGVGDFIAEQFVEHINKISQYGNIDKLVHVDALHYLLSGFDLLFDHTNNTAILSAQSRFQNAISVDPELVEAHAGLCIALSYESYMNNAAVSFEQALKYCEQANKIDATSEYSELAFATYYLNKADVDSAENALLQNQYSPISVADELSLKAQISFQRHQDGQVVQGADIIEPAMQSIQYAPELWRAYNILGQYYLSKGKTDKSMLILAQGAEASKHSVLLSNVGSLQLCQGDLESAKTTYLSLIEQKPMHYLAYEMLGSVYYYQHQYDSALMYRKQALERLPETNIHQLWGVIGLVYAKLNKLEQGKPYLLKAIELIDQDESMQIAGLSELISREYYEFVMSGLDTATVDQKLVNNGLKDVDSLQLTPRVHLSQLLKALKQNDDAEMVKQSASSICPIFDRT